MRALTLIEAAVFLNMTPDGLRKKVITGTIPGAKVGKRWCFLKNDLVEYLRSLYPNNAKASWGVRHRRKIWHSTKEVTRGGSQLVSKEREYRKVVGLPIK
jgi:excisionase family DNA binding protein